MLRTTLLAAFVALGLASPASAEWGNLSGQFIYDGAAPTPAPVLVTKDQQVCGIHNLVDEVLTVNPTNKGLAGVVVFVYVDRGGKAPEIHPSYVETAKAEVRFDNLNCRFEPHVVLLRTTQTLVIGNRDPIGHNSKVDTVKNAPINPIIPANGEVKQNFSKEERLPSKVTCSIHPWMNGWVVIKETPYMAVTDADGRFEIANLPTGKWSFQVWHEKSGYIDSVVLGGKKTKWSKGRFEHQIASAANDLGEIMVPATVFAK